MPDQHSELARLLAESPNKYAHLTHGQAFIQSAEHLDRIAKATRAKKREESRKQSEARLVRWNQLLKQANAHFESPKAQARANAAEWLAEYLYKHGPVSMGQLFEAAAAAKLSPADLSKAATDLEAIVELPDKLYDLMQEAELRDVLEGKEPDGVKRPAPTQADAAEA